MPNQIDIVKEIIFEWQKIINNDILFQQKLSVLLESVNEKKNIIELEEDGNHIHWKREHYENQEILSCLIWESLYLKIYPANRPFTQTSVQQACKEILESLQ